MILRAASLACIAHKSLEIFERCRLWQRYSPAQRENAVALFRLRIRDSVFGLFLFALKQTPSVFLRAF
jgi:hypothetical protein